MSGNTDKKCILIVDDSPDDIHVVMESLRDEYAILVATNGEKALEMANKEPVPDVILMDVMMPIMDGFEACKLLKENPDTQKIPVIFITATVDQEAVSKGIELGAYYYLTKPIDPTVVLAVVRSVLTQVSEYNNLQEEVEKAESIMSLLNNGSFQFRTIEESNRLANVLAKMAPDPMQLGTGLTELMLNAVEHGNLGITYEDKSLLNDRDEWRQEVERRLSLHENINKQAIIHIERDNTEIRFRIIDQGIGFEWQSYLEIDANRADHTHGRGIAMSNMLSFDKLEYQGNGNEVIAVYHL